ADLAQRRLRLEKQVADAARDLETLEGRLAALADPAEKQEELEAAETAHEDGGTAFASAERALAQARQTEANARKPLDEARAALQMVETEARTIERMLAAGRANTETPVAEMISADRGMEAALGAVLGDDLDSALTDTAAAYWSMPRDGADDPA